MLDNKKETTGHKHKEVEDRLVARWETRGKDWLELIHAPGTCCDYWYRGNGCCGGIPATGDEEAIARMEAERGSKLGWGPAAVLKCDRPSLHRVSTYIITKSN
jgi:hypothetical protein